MWPIVDKRRKKRRHIKYKLTKNVNRRMINRRKDLNWINLFIGNEDEPDIS